MKNIIVVSKDPTTFISSSLNVFKITAEDLYKEVEAPAWVADTATFKSLLANKMIRIVQKGSYEVNAPVSDKKGDSDASAEERPNVQETAESESEGASAEEGDVSEPKRSSRKKKDDAE